MVLAKWGGAKFRPRAQLSPKFQLKKQIWSFKNRFLYQSFHENITSKTRKLKIFHFFEKKILSFGTAKVFFCIEKLMSVWKNSAKRVRFQIMPALKWYSLQKPPITVPFRAYLTHLVMNKMNLSWQPDEQNSCGARWKIQGRYMYLINCLRSRGHVCRACVFMASNSTRVCWHMLLTTAWCFCALFSSMFTSCYAMHACWASESLSDLYTITIARAMIKQKKSRKLSLLICSITSYFGSFITKNACTWGPVNRSKQYVKDITHYNITLSIGSKEISSFFFFLVSKRRVALKWLPVGKSHLSNLLLLLVAQLVYNIYTTVVHVLKNPGRGHTLKRSGPVLLLRMAPHSIRHAEFI